MLEYGRAQKGMKEHVMSNHPIIRTFKKLFVQKLFCRSYEPSEAVLMERFALVLSGEQEEEVVVESTRCSVTMKDGGLTVEQLSR